MTKAIIGLLAAELLAVLPAGAESIGKIPVCVDSGNYRSIQVLMRAKIITTRMFAGAGVAVEWLRPGSAACRNAQQTQAIVLEFLPSTPPGLHPGAFAYARPYEGEHIVVLLDRIENSVPDTEVPSLLAHVMTHEITHLLEGIARHSQTGVMKARFDVEDFELMTHSTLPFAPEDLDLIRDGLARRSARAETAAPPASAAVLESTAVRPRE